MKIYILAILLSIYSLNFAQGNKDEVDISKLTGDFSNFKGRLFSGYIQIPDTDRKYFYTLAGSQNDFDKDPVVVFFNGGLGCSSLYSFYH